MNRKPTDHPTTAPDDAPARWLSAPASGDGPTERLAALIRAGEPPSGLTSASRARIWARLAQRRPAMFERRNLLGLRWGVAAAVLLTSGGVIGAVTAHRWWPSVAPEIDELPAGDGARPVRRARGSRRAHGEPAPAATTAEAMVAAETAPAPIANPPPPVAPVSAPMVEKPARRSLHLALATPRPVPEPAPQPPPGLTPPPAPTQSTLAAETQLLQQAVTLLRQRGDGARALAALDTYDERFPRGTLRREADGARVDALLLLGRDDEALAVLRTLTLRPQGRDQELRVIRGELLAPGRCARAVADFDAVLAQSPPPALAERALYGRAACRLRQRDTAGAARDLDEYLRRFPGGQFAADARRALRENKL